MERSTSYLSQADDEFVSEVLLTVLAKKMYLKKFHRPVGLRPPPYDFSCSPPLIQSLYHIPLFRTAILCQKPTPSNWGSTENYWKGTGRGIPDVPKPTIDTIDIQPPPYELVVENSMSAEKKMGTDMEKLSLNSITPDSESSYGSDDTEERSVLENADQNGFLAAKSAANLKGECEVLLGFSYLGGLFVFSGIRIAKTFRFPLLYQ